MQSSALGSQWHIARWAGISAVVMLLWATPAIAQFRDVTPQAASETEQEPLSPRTSSRGRPR